MSTSIEVPIRFHHAYVGAPMVTLCLPFYFVNPQERKILLVPIFLGIGLIVYDIIYHLLHPEV